MPRQTLLQNTERLRRRVRILEQIQVLGRNHSVFHQGVEVEDLAPVIAAVEHDQNFAFELLRLRERQDLAQLIQRSESARKYHQRLGQVGEPELAHEEVVKLERQLRRDERIRPLLERKSDIQADGLAAGVL